MIGECFAYLVQRIFNKDKFQYTNLTLNEVPDNLNI